MAVGKRRDLVATRRRKADEGEEDEVGSLDYESQSEPSVLSGANESFDDEGSEGSHLPPNGGDGTAVPTQKRVGNVGNAYKSTKDNVTTQRSGPSNAPIFTHTADTAAMLNGLKPSAEAKTDNVIQFQDNQDTPQSNGGLQHKDVQPTQPLKRENQKGFINKPKDLKAHLNPINTLATDSPRNVRRKGRESSFGVAMSVSDVGPSTTSGRWNHDLHDLIENDMADKQEAQPIVEDIPRRNLPNLSASAKGPEPLSRTVTIGHVALRVLIPHMSKPITYEKMPLKYHIRLPDLRPPLRRDKPVRVAVPYHTPHYIFPSVDRSFIFIPRAQRPNQQPGRRPFGSRRNSNFGGSSYSPSVAMSRRSSIAREGILSPAATTFTKPPLGAPSGPSRPVVKLPAGMRAQHPSQNGEAPRGPSIMPMNGVTEVMYPPPGKPAFESQWTGQIPVHQPRPQKTVSVTTIESPSKVKIHPPHQLEQQPFHHQVPNHVNGTRSYPEYPSTQPQTGNMGVGTFQQAGTPSQQNLPENAVNAQPFQPDQPQMFYPAPYPMQDIMMFPGADGQGSQYTPQPMMAPPVYLQPAAQGSYLVPMMSPAAMPQLSSVTEAPMGTSAYESNGTVYYYDASQYGESAPSNNTYPPITTEGDMKSGNDTYFAQPTVNYYPTQ